MNPLSFSSLQTVTSLLQRKQHFHPFDIHSYQLTAVRHRVSSTEIMAESVQTRPGDPPRLDYAVPVVTALAALDNRDVIYGRQIYGNCGYYEHDDYTGRVLSFFTSEFNFMLRIHEKLICLVSLEWQTWMCSSGSVTATACNTINNYFGCSFPVTTICYASNRGCNTQDSQALCWFVTHVYAALTAN